METLNAAELLAALGHESRLSIYRVLVEAGPQGVHAGTIGERWGCRLRPCPSISRTSAAWHWPAGARKGVS